jgi:hypothetical protein
MLHHLHINIRGTEHHIEHESFAVAIKIARSILEQYRGKDVDFANMMLNARRVHWRTVGGSQITCTHSKQ